MSIPSPASSSSLTTTPPPSPEQQTPARAPTRSYWSRRTARHRNPPTLADDAEASASLFSRLTFSWVTPLIRRGASVPLDLDDLPQLNDLNSAHHLQAIFHQTYAALSRQSTDQRSPTSHSSNVADASHSHTTARTSPPAHTPAQSPRSLSRLTHLATAVPPRFASKTLRALIPVSGFLFFLAGITKPIHLLSSITQVYVIRSILRYLTTPTADRSSPWPYVPLALLLPFFAVIMSISQHNTFACSTMSGLRAKAAIISAIYRKMLRLSPAALAVTSEGEIGTLLVADTQRVLDSSIYFHFCALGFFDLFVIIVLLFIELGPAAFFGLAVMAVLVPAQIAFATLVSHARSGVSSQSDVRVQKMNELLSGIRTVKLSAWEPHFKSVIEQLRSREIRQLRVSAVARSLNTATFFVAPVIVSAAVFTSYTLLFKRQLTPDVALSSLAFFGIISKTLTLLPLGWLGASEVSVAFKRLDAFFDLPELPNVPESDRLDSPAASQLPPSPPSVATLRPETFQQQSDDLQQERLPVSPYVYVRNATFSYAARSPNTESNAPPALSGITISAESNQLVCIVGPVGCGKTSLLHGILGEIKASRGSVDKFGRIAYCSQQPWIVNGTVRHNITMFGKAQPAWDPEWYDRVLDACCLRPDMAALPASDLTEIGERGINISGGQKARLALARAIYADADIYLLDDPFSAVDAKVSARLLRNVVGPGGLLAHKTQVLVTHHIHVLPFAAKVILLGGGTVQHAGTYEELRHIGVEFSALTIPTDCDNSDDASSGIDCEDSDAEDAAEKFEEGRLQQFFRDSKVPIPEMDDNGSDKNEKFSPAAEELMEDLTKELEEDDAISDGVHDPHVGKDRDNVEETDHKLVAQEDRMYGLVSARVYKAYVDAGGGWLALVAVISVFLGAQALHQVADIWIAKWSVGVSVSASDSGTDLFTQNWEYARVFLALSGGFLVLTLFRAGLLAQRMMAASQNLHNRLLDRVLHATCTFFDTNPIGRILNRFGKDVDVIDMAIPIAAQEVLQVFIVLIGTLITIAYIIPWFLLSLFPVVGIFAYLQNLYKKSSREIKRLDGLSFSPVYSHVLESSVGLTTIRAFRFESDFSSRMEELVNFNVKAFHMSIISNRWLGVRLDLISAIVVLTTAVIVLALSSTIDPALAGVALAQSILLTGNFQWGVRQAAEMENFFTSVERVHTMATETPEEAPYEISENKPEDDWPSQGVLAFQDVVLKYQPELDPALNGLSFKTKPRERIGIVGRTGSGKSTLFVSLFRLVELSGGSILLDGKDISELGLHDLRKRMAIVPQDPVLFHGTIRSNLDPTGQYSDSELWDSIHCVHMTNAINMSADGSQDLAAYGLDVIVQEKGSNFSAGERQLLSLARAILSGVQVVVLDEASASLDNHTDMLIQKTVREQLSDRTVLTIAHRLATIADSDRVLVIDAGEVVEFDKPAELVRSGGMFAKLIEETGPVESAILKAMIAQSKGCTSGGESVA